MTNIDQIEYWNKEGGARWRAGAESTAKIFAPLTDRLMRFAAPQAGEQVVDVGCGTGRTVIELARRVGSQGRVVGLDVSRVLLDVAREALISSGTANATLVLDDATTHDFGRYRFDLLFSQFGVMFFADPIAAFSNLRRAMVPGGRAAFACWREIEVNPWISVPYEAAKPFAPPIEAAPPGAPGPLAFADPKRLERVLSEAGFTDVQITPNDESLLICELDGVDPTANYLANMGLTGRLLSGADPESKARATATIADTLRARATAAGVHLASGIWLVSARNG